MTDTHTLSDMQSLDVGTEGKGSLGRIVAICACGWSSPPEPDRQSAMDRFEEHAMTTIGHR